MAQQRSEAWRPSTEQELLIRAATDDGDRARDAWQQWIAAVDWAKLDEGSQRILPLLYRNLLRLHVEHPALSRFGKAYRRTWAMNQLALRYLEVLIHAFDEQGIQTLVLKGAALIVSYYKDIGVRTMADFDLLVPLAQTSAAMNLLVKLGWHSTKPLHLLPDNHRSPFHGIGFFHDQKAIGCDLHWHVMHMHLSPIYDAPMWEASVPLQVGSAQSRALCAEHQLIHLLFNGCVNEGGSNMRWLPDALLLLKHESALDWGRFEAQCQKLEFVQPVAAMLEYLRTTWGMAVPEATVDRLAKTPVSYRMRKVYECLNTHKEERSGLQLFWLLYTQYQLAQPEKSRSFPLGFVQFLRHRWSLDGGIGRTLNYAWQRTRGVAAEQAKDMV